MKKLNLQDLEVESFSTADSGPRMGTVMGHMPDSLHSCPAVGCNTLDETCGTGGGDTWTQVHTCEPTCADGCHLSLGGDPADFSCNPDCFSYYTNCHRCTFWT